MTQRLRSPESWCFAAGCGWKTSWRGRWTLTPGFAPRPGLGASDAAGETHVFRVGQISLAGPDVAAVLPISR